MRPLVLIGLAAAGLSFLWTPQAAAHIPGESPGTSASLKTTLTFQEHAYDHAVYVCRRGTGEPKRWHCAWVPILRTEIAKTRAKLIPQTPGFAPGCGYSCVKCETGGTFDPQIVSPGGTYWGWYQFDLPTWLRHGGGRSLYGSAPSGYQTLIASRVNYDAWPNC